MDKQALRKMLLEQNVSPLEWDGDGKKACEAIARFPLFIQAKTVACYMPLANEPNVECVCRLVLDKGKTLLLPRVLSKRDMGFFRVNSLDGLKKSPYGILEPKLERPAYEGNIDLMVIPLVAMSPDGTRLGHGAGYYDRYLNMHPCTTVGVVNKNRLILSLPKENHDVKVNYYIVDGEIYPCGGK